MSEKRIYNVNLLLHWNTVSTLKQNIMVPFPCRKVVIKPVIHDYTDNGAAPNPYEHARITCSMVSDNNGDATFGVILPVVWSSGAAPIAGFTYMFDSPKMINSSYTFNAILLDGTAIVLATDSFMMMEFYEA